MFNTSAQTSYVIIIKKIAQSIYFQNFVLCLLYYFSGKLGLSILPISKFATLVWPPTGLSLFSLFNWGYQLWPGIFLGAFLANLSTGAYPIVAIGIGVGNTAEALIGAYLLQKFFAIHSSLDRLKDVLALITVGVTSSPVSATIGTLCLWAGKIVKPSDIPMVYLTWWTGDVVSDLILTPFLLILATHNHLPRTLKLGRLAEIISLSLILLLLSYLIFSRGLPAGTQWKSLLYLTFPLIVWATLRFGQLGAVLTSFVLTVFSIWRATQSQAPFQNESSYGTLLSFQLYQGVTAMTGLILAATITELRYAQRMIRKAEEEQRFLATVGPILSSSLELSATFNKIAHLAVPYLADWCLVDRVKNGIKQVAVAHIQPEKEKFAWGLDRKFPSDPLSGRGAGYVIQTGRSEIYSQIRDMTWMAETLNTKHPELLHSLGVNSYMCVPMIARGDILGAMTFIIASTHKNYDAHLLALAEEVARRAASALDNSILFGETQKAVLLREEIMAIVSHDLKNPLTAIDLNASLLEALIQTGGKADRVRQKVERIHHSVEIMNRLISDLLDFAKIQGGKVAPDLVHCKVEVLFDEVRELFSPAAMRKSISLNSSLAPNTPPVTCDRNRILQVLSNLVGNSIKFTPEGGRIVMNAKKVGNEVEFSVSDSGIGILKEDLPHIFDRFWQARTATHQGAGLGLSIVKGLIEAQGGRIWAVSKIGKGSTFHFTLPITKLPELQGH